MLADAGVTAMDTRTAAVTVRLAGGLDIPPKVAVMFTGPPSVTPVARPAMTVATAVSLVPHDAPAVRFWVLPSV
jgi:hypothetical protein